MSTGEQLEVARRRGADVLKIIMRYRGVSSAALAPKLGLSRQTVQYHTVGKTRLEIGLMAGFADALDVIPDVFFMSPDEALLWTIANRPNPPAQGICTAPWAYLRRSGLHLKERLADVAA